MRNKHPGQCYRCGSLVEAGEGHFERYFGTWRVQHASCAIEHRGKPDPERQLRQIDRLRHTAAGTGRSAQRARKKLREQQMNGGGDG